MPVDEQDLLHIQAAATSLDERLERAARSVCNTAVPRSSEQARLRLAFWETIIERVDGFTLDARLQAEGWSRPLLPSVLEDAPGSTLDLGAVPSWVSLLAAISTNAWRNATSPDSPPAAGRDCVAFWPLLQPFVDVAQSCLLKSVDGNPAIRKLLADNLDSLSTGLVDRLSWLAWRPLFAEFAAARPSEVLLRAMLESSADTPPPATFFDRWCARHLEDGLRDLLTTYPVLGRLAAEAIEDWCRGSREMIERFVADWPTLRNDDAQHGRCALPEIVDVKTCLSDPHDGGRTVSRIALDSGLVVYYKPRSVELEAAFNSFLDFLTGLGSPVGFRTVRIVSKPGYGWAEAAEPAPCADEAEVGQFYRESGALMCVLDVLGAADAHRENVIACGPHPVLVDAETVMHPDAPRAEWMVTPLLTRLSDSVLRTGLLPRWDFSLNDYHPLTMSGLWTGETSPADVACLVAANSDLQSIATREAQAGTPHNAPYVGDRRYPCTGYVTQLVTGYAEMHRFFQRRAEQVVGSPAFRRFRGPVVRYVFRRTASYAQALEVANDPAALTSGVDRSLALELLAPAFAAEHDQEPRWWMLKAERQSLWRMDIPYFASPTDAAVMRGPGPADEAALHRPSCEAAHQRLLTMDDKDLQIQLALITQVLTPPRRGAGHSLREGSLPSDEWTFRPLVDEVVRELLDRRLGDPGDDIAWIGIKYDLIHNSRSFHAIGAGLYDGLIGVALALAAYESAGGALPVAETIDRVLVSVHGLLQRLQRLDQRQRRHALGPGLGAGVAGLLYGLVTIGQATGRTQALELALDYARLAPAAMETSARVGDVLSGLPGLAISLCALADITDEPWVREQLWAIGRRISTDIASEVAAGQEHGTLASASFAHGTAGRLSSLMRLHVCLEADRFARPIQAGTRKLGRHLTQILRTDLARPADADPSTFSWCNGLVGMGAGLVEWIHWLTATSQDASMPAAALRELADHLIQRLPHNGKDVLCCGNWGAVELLNDAAGALGSAKPRQAARALATAIITDRAKGAPWTVLADTPLGVFNPGLFQGYAGIAMTLLRLDTPAAAASVLRFANRRVAVGDGAVRG